MNSRSLSSVCLSLSLCRTTVMTFSVMMSPNSRQIENAFSGPFIANILSNSSRWR